MTANLEEAAGCPVDIEEAEKQASEDVVAQREEASHLGRAQHHNAVYRRAVPAFRQQHGIAQHVVLPLLKRKPEVPGHFE